MKEIRKTSQFKKDFKRFAKDVEKVKTLMSIVEKLERGEFIPDEFYPHPLKGEWKNYMECHIDDDYLLYGLIRRKVLLGSFVLVLIPSCLERERKDSFLVFSVS